MQVLLAYCEIVLWDRTCKYAITRG
jgi:hypothetical protein